MWIKPLKIARLSCIERPGFKRAHLISSSDPSHSQSAIGDYPNPGLLINVALIALRAAHPSSLLHWDY